MIRLTELVNPHVLTADVRPWSGPKPSAPLCVLEHERAARLRVQQAFRHSGCTSSNGCSGPPSFMEYANEFFSHEDWAAARLFSTPSPSQPVEMRGGPCGGLPWCFVRWLFGVRTRGRPLRGPTPMLGKSSKVVLNPMCSFTCSKHHLCTQTLNSQWFPKRIWLALHNLATMSWFSKIQKSYPCEGLNLQSQVFYQA